MSASNTEQKQHFWITDLLSTLFLAFCIGVATSAVLGAVVVLMASEARAEGVQPIDTVPVAPAQARPGALLFAPDEGDDAVAAPLLGSDVVVRVSGTVAHARVTQTFVNPYGEARDGLYVFPLPENSAVDRLRVTIGGRVADGMQDAGPLEGRPDLFAASLEGIAPHENVVVELEYRQALGPRAALTLF